MNTSRLVLFALLASAAAPAAAVELTFEGFDNATYTAPIVRSGFSIGNVAGDEQHFHELDSPGFAGYAVNNGTGVLYNDRNSRLFIESATAGQTFTFGAFDASANAASSPAAGATALLIQGFLNGNLVASNSFAINSTNSLSYSTSLSGTFDRLVFAANGGGGFQLDNVNLNAGAVPEPATWAMMIGGFGLAGAAMRRRAKVAFA